MKKKLPVISLIVLFALALSACSNTASSGSMDVPEVTDSAAAATSTGTSLDDAAGQSLQLVVGISKLRGTQTQVEAAQAATLLPLLQSFQPYCPVQTTM